MTKVIHSGDGVPYIDPKDPNSNEWFEFAWMLESGESISSNTWLVNGAVTEVGAQTDGLTVEEQSLNGSAIKVRLSGGTLNKHYTITSRIVTNVQPQRDRSLRFKVEHL